MQNIGYRYKNVQLPEYGLLKGLLYPCLKDPSDRICPLGEVDLPPNRGKVEFTTQALSYLTSLN